MIDRALRTRAKMGNVRANVQNGVIFCVAAQKWVIFARPHKIAFFAPPCKKRVVFCAALQKGVIGNQLSTEAWAFWNAHGPPGVSCSTTATRIACRTGKSVVDSELAADVDGRQCGDYASH